MRNSGGNNSSGNWFLFYMAWFNRDALRELAGRILGFLECCIPLCCCITELGVNIAAVCGLISQPVRNGTNKILEEVKEVCVKEVVNLEEQVDPAHHSTSTEAHNAQSLGADNRITAATPTTLLEAEIDVLTPYLRWFNQHIPIALGYLYSVISPIIVPYPPQFVAAIVSGIFAWFRAHPAQMPNRAHEELNTHQAHNNREEEAKMPHKDDNVITLGDNANDDTHDLA